YYLANLRVEANPNVVASIELRITGLLVATSRMESDSRQEEFQRLTRDGDDDDPDFPSGGLGSVSIAPTELGWVRVRTAPSHRLTSNFPEVRHLFGTLDGRLTIAFKRASVARAPFRLYASPTDVAEAISAFLTTTNWRLGMAGRTLSRLH